MMLGISQLVDAILEFEENRKTPMYNIRLTDAELETLGWAADRGYFPDVAYDALTLEDGQPEDVDRHTERMWELPEWAAWSIMEHREEDPHSLFTCIGGELLEKCIALENSIV